MLTERDHNEIFVRLKTVDFRQKRGLEIASSARIKFLEPNKLWEVPSQNRNEQPIRKYTVSNNFGKYRCTCDDHNKHQDWCKHIWSVQFLRLREELAIKTKEPKSRARDENRKPRLKTYQRDWPSYRGARVNEGDIFLPLLSDLLDNVYVKEERKRGPNVHWKEAIIAIVMKVYERKSADKFMSNHRRVVDQGFISSDRCSNTVLNYMNRTDFEQILHDAIAVSCLPLYRFEEVLAVDSTGVTATERIPFYEVKHGGATSTPHITAHMACGVKTNIVAAVQITKKGDSVVFPTLFDQAIDRLNVKEVVADKAYSTDNVYSLIKASGLTAYIEHKRNHNGAKASNAFRESLNFFHNNQEEFYAHYNQRSNVESVFSMIKRNHGSTMKFKTDQAKRNEVLCKVLCHNICCLIHASFELGADLSVFKKTVH